jgi:penicillin-binding protein 1C
LDGPGDVRSASFHSSHPMRVRLFRRLIPFVFFPLLTGGLLSLPDASLRRVRFGWEGVVIADRTGKTLYSIPGRSGGYQHRLSWYRIPDAVKTTFVRLEDRRFFSHPGVDPLAVGRAAFLNLKERRIVSGASTISMQLARLIHPHGRGVTGKLGEALRALCLESRLSKRQILLLYLNNLPFGYNTVGVGAAARTYFSAEVEELTAPQILLLAVIPKAPGLYDPFASPENRDALRKRAASLAPLLSISPEQVDLAMGTFSKGGAEFRAPHFVRVVIESAGQIDELKDLEVGRILTTLDVELYDGLNEIVRGRLAAVERSAESAGGSADRSGAATPGPRNASALVLDNHGGDILAWVGSQDFFDSENGGQIDGVLRKNSSGSTLKPFLYAAALERGYTASTLLPDMALTFGAEEGYRPENFDRRSRGLVRLRTALASSLNVPAVYLLSQLGLQEFLTLCSQLGIAVPEDAAARVGLGAAVGNLEVSLLELVRAFGVFPGGGILPEVRLIREVETAEGRRVPMAGHQGEENGSPKRIFQQQTAWLISDILADPSARAAGFGPDSRFNTSFPAIFKSGTASEYTSLWCLGAIADYSVGVWAGNFDGRPAFGSTGSSLPAEVAVRVLEELNGGYGGRTAAPTEARPADPPPGLTEVRICSQSGFPATPACPATRAEYYLPGSVPAESCPVHATGVSMEELLVRSILGQERRVKILFPRNRMIFYREDSTAATGQGIPGWIAADPADRITVRLNGRRLQPDDPSRPLLPVHPGHYRLEVVGRFGEDVVNYTVR